MPDARKNLPQVDLDFSNPEHCRRFMAGFHFPDGKKIAWVKVKDGRVIFVEKATDEEIIFIASQVYTDLYSPEGSEAYWEEEWVN